MGFSAIRDQMIKTLKTVEGIGVVQDHVDHTVTWQDHFERHKIKNKLNFWEITRRGATQDIRSIQNAAGNEPCFFDRHETVIIGRFSLSDHGASERVMQDIIDGVVEAFRLDNTLGGLVLLPRQPQIAEIGHRDYGGVLVHYVEITFEAVEAVGG